MFDTVGTAPPRGPRDPWGWARRWARGWVVRGLAIALAVAFIGFALYLGALYRAAFEEECDQLAELEVDMPELIRLRAELTAYQSDPSPDAALSFTGRELSFLFGDRADFHMRMEFFDDRASVRMVVPTEGGCYNVAYFGRVWVRDGTVTIVPERVEIGEADLTRFVAGRPWRIAHERMPDAILSEHVDNTESLEIRDGLAIVRLKNRWDVW